MTKRVSIAGGVYTTIDNIFVMAIRFPVPSLGNDLPTTDSTNSWTMNLEIVAQSLKSQSKAQGRDVLTRLGFEDCDSRLFVPKINFLQKARTETKNRRFLSLPAGSG